MGFLETLEMRSFPARTTRIAGETPKLKRHAMGNVPPRWVAYVRPRALKIVFGYNLTGLPATAKGVSKTAARDGPGEGRKRRARKKDLVADALCLSYTWKARCACGCRDPGSHDVWVDEVLRCLLCSVYCVYRVVAVEPHWRFWMIRFCASVDLHLTRWDAYCMSRGGGGGGGGGGNVFDRTLRVASRA